MTAARSVGTDVPRVDGLEKVTGAAQYTADLKFPRLLHVAVVRSPHPHARVLDVRTEKAARMPGVRAVVSGRDFPLHTGIYLKDQTVFATDRVRFVGDPVAAVAAETPEAAAEAAAARRGRLRAASADLRRGGGVRPGGAARPPRPRELRGRPVDPAEGGDERLQPPEDPEGRLRDGARRLRGASSRTSSASRRSSTSRWSRTSPSRASTSRGRSRSTPRRRARSRCVTSSRPASASPTATSGSTCRTSAAASAGRRESTSSRSPSRSPCAAAAAGSGSWSTGTRSSSRRS